MPQDAAACLPIDKPTSTRHWAAMNRAANSPFYAVGLVVLLAACGSESTTPDGDSQSDATDTSVTGPDTSVEASADASADSGVLSDIGDTLSPSDLSDTLSPSDMSDTASPSDLSDSSESGPCPFGTVCASGWCISPRTTNQCVTDADCPGSATFCNPEAVGGICLGCGTDSDCPIGAVCGVAGACAFECESDGDCPNGTCYTAQGLCGQRRCSVDGDCPSGTACLEGGLCGRVSCPDPCAPNPCDAINRSVCVAEGTGHRCECDPGYTLDANGACVLPDPGPCTGGLSCLGSRCADADANGFQCALDSDCGAGQTCSTALPSGICTGCASTDDCPAGHTCLAGRCLASCTNDSGCHPGMRCNNGFCGQKLCTNNADCGPDHDCDLTAAEPRCVRRACD